jgi:4-hydroxy 2-oxovalerate aldolase
MTHVNILDTTLRDGAYSVGFGFTAEDTAAICGALEAAGFRYIEIGHGIGLGAARSGLGMSAATDAEYARAARDTLTEAAYGMFAIPGIATLDDVQMAADLGMRFIRVGTDVTDVAESEPFIKAAERLGMLVMTNIMKSYTIPPAEFAQLVKQSESYGSRVAYLVDSAGCMSPEEVVEYHHAIRAVSDIPVGFHGHDNLGMAVYNSLRIVDVGATFVDSSLQGLGRGAGNAVTEALVAALHKRGYSTGVDLLHTLRAGYKLVHPLREKGGVMPLDVVAGYAGFHSSFIPKALRVARRHQIDPAALIIEVCRVDRVRFEDEMVEEIAVKMGSGAESYLGHYGDHDV